MSIKHRKASTGGTGVPSPSDVGGPGSWGPERRGRAYSTKRVPAWCDRVLWHSWPGSEATLDLESYDSAPELESSDHSPVYARFLLDVSMPWLTDLTLPCDVELVLSQLAA